MKKETKVIDVTKLFRIVLILFCVGLAVSVTLAFWGFCVPPKGIIDASILQVISIIMGSITAFEGFVLGFVAIIKGKKTSAKIGNIEISAENDKQE